jgi:hypothetical protein
VADSRPLRVIVEHPNSPMAEQAEEVEQERPALVHERLKSRLVGGFRTDVMMSICV